MKCINSDLPLCWEQYSPSLEYFYYEGFRSEVKCNIHSIMSLIFFTAFIFVYYHFIWRVSVVVHPRMKLLVTI